MTNSKQFKSNRITLSAFRADLDLADNYNRHEELKNGLSNLGLKPETVIGYYKEEGQDKASQELSLRVVDLNHEQLDLVYKLAVHYEQDSILTEDCNEVLLMLCNNEHAMCFSDTVKLGTELVEVSKEELIANGAGAIVGTRCYIVQ